MSSEGTGSRQEGEGEGGNPSPSEIKKTQPPRPRPVPKNRTQNQRRSPAWEWAEQIEEGNTNDLKCLLYFKFNRLLEARHCKAMQEERYDPLVNNTEMEAESEFMKGVLEDEEDVDNPWEDDVPWDAVEDATGANDIRYPKRARADTSSQPSSRSKGKEKAFVGRFEDIEESDGEGDEYGGDNDMSTAIGDDDDGLCLYDDEA